MIYLASPYSDPDPKVMEQRFDAVCRKAGELMKDGLVVYSPIIHNHPIATRCDLPRGWDFWKRFDLFMLPLASKLYILRLPGWDKSIGVKAERETAEALRTPTIEIDP